MAAKIIQFPAKHSNAYNNLSQLIGIADTVKAVNFYAETVDYMKNTGKYLPGEYEKLVEAYRSKRLELAQEKPQGTFETEKPGVYTYTPEMGQEKPICQMEASRGYYGGHMYVDTPLELKGRGIVELTDVHWVEGSRKAREHWRSYRVTNKAYEKLKEQYTISMECCLD